MVKDSWKVIEVHGIRRLEITPWTYDIISCKIKSNIDKEVTDCQQTN
jgi:hypothetical protein